jgi:branched-chain amino acid transport system substrate-binding protein
MINRKQILAVAVTVISLMLSSLAGAADTIPIGVMYSLTGPGSVLGILQMEGAKLAVKEINAAGGIPIGGKAMMLEGVFRDDETNPQVAIRRLKEMKQGQKVSALVGGTFGHVSMALNGESKRAKVFLMTTNGVPEKFFQKSERSPTALNIMATSESAGRGAAAYIGGALKASKVACFMPDYVIGKTTYKGYEAVMAEAQGVSSKPFWVPVKTADMTPYLIKVKEFQPDVLFMGSWGGDAINALKAANEMGISKNMKIFHFWLANVFAVGIPAEAMSGIWSQMFWYWNMDGFKDSEVVAASKAFSDSYIAAYGNPPDPYAMAAYTGVYETARAMILAESTDPEEMVKALMADPFWKGPKGEAVWREDGRPVYKYATYIVEGKGPEDRDGTHAKYDYAKIVDAYDGEAFLPPLAELGY